jgi:hypothetical protein
MTKAVVHCVTSRPRSHLSCTVGQVIRVRPTPFWCFSIHSSHTWGEVEGVLDLAFHDVGGEMEFGDKALEKEVNTAFDGVWPFVDITSFPKSCEPLTPNVI